jgi:hypothetical protein
MTSADRSRSLSLLRGCDGPLGVELFGFHNLTAEGRRCRPRAIELPPVPERLRKGDAKSGPPVPLPVKALRRLQRVGLVTRTCGSTGSGVPAEIGEGEG